MNNIPTYDTILFLTIIKTEKWECAKGVRYFSKAKQRKQEMKVQDNPIPWEDSQGGSVH